MIDEICISPDSLIRTAVQKMNKSGRQIILIVNDEKKLIGIFSDGDLRRALINGATLDTSVKEFYNNKPLSTLDSKGRARAVEKMREHGVDQMPVVDSYGVVCGLEAINPSQYGIKINNPVVIMAGGLGKRLDPITKDKPKALVPVGERPILEIILDRLISQGFQNFILAINHFGEIIEDYFGNGDRWNVSIEYLRETKRMGTAGALSLFQDRPENPFIVMNCDVLTTTNFQEMLEFHKNEGADICMGIRESVYQIPYGVVNFENSRLIRIDEKPDFKYHINTGMYCLSPNILEFIPKDHFFDMPELIELLIKNKKNISCYKVKNYWIDIGQHEDLERARSEYHLHF